MKHKRVKRCKDCGKETTDLSQHGLCYDCSVRHMLAAQAQMVDHYGPIYDKWKRNLSRSLEKRSKK